jgi:hypothetical protein
MMTAFAAMGALLIGLANSSTMVEKVLHYPRPGPSVIEKINPQPRDLLDAPRIKKEEVPARDQPEKNINDSRVLFAKADTAKRKLEIKDKPLRLAHKPKVPAPQREKYEGGHGYAMSVGQGPGYHRRASCSFSASKARISGCTNT